MLDITKDIQSLTTFRRRSGEFLKQLKKSKRPVVLTVKGKAAAIVQDAAAYQRLLDIAANAVVKKQLEVRLEVLRCASQTEKRGSLLSKPSGSKTASTPPLRP